ncbi:hypothetical protein EJ06DRAFT_35013 [Trichodelitschia bisporula]|uniref:Uncharacterized protein n=1 Tax=Trichodelitschia bisporula TaxID=703511 RepID=A0A6G1HUU3_9PEZI|nr:hypothetical protein EJ06DRAFT_35013 [Trichodelitschia bisporula]
MSRCGRLPGRTPDPKPRPARAETWIFRTTCPASCRTIRPPAPQRILRHRRRPGMDSSGTDRDIRRPRAGRGVIIILNTAPKKSRYFLQKYTPGPIHPCSVVGAGAYMLGDQRRSTHVWWWAPESASPVVGAGACCCAISNLEVEDPRVGWGVIKILTAPETGGNGEEQVPARLRT